MGLPAVQNKDGVPIIDADEDQLIVVTPNQVRHAVPGDPHRCAVALACSLLPDVVEATIHRSFSYLTYEDRIVRYETPLALRYEIVAIDRGGHFAAGEYILRRPGKSRRLIRNGGTRSQKGKTNSHSSKTKRQHHTVAVRVASS